MSLEIRLLSDADRQAYEACLQRPEHLPHLTFFHTWEWGEVMTARALRVQRVGLYEGNDLVAVGQLALQRLKLGTYWYCPRGLVLDYTNADLVRQAYAALRQYYRGRNGAGFLRVDPNIVVESDEAATMLALGAKAAPIFTQAERIWVAELQQDDDSLIAWLRHHGMRKKLPYYLRKTAAAGVTWRASSDPADLEILISMLNDLNVRKGGIGKPADEHYRRQFAALAPRGYEMVFLAEKDGKPLAGSLMGLYGQEACYLHGASTKDHPELTAAHFLHIETMKYLQRERPEIRQYNFWGIVGDKNRTPKHPRHGYSEFKRSFGGYKLTYVRGRDFVYNPVVWGVAWVLDKYRTWRYKND